MASARPQGILQGGLSEGRDPGVILESATWQLPLRKYIQCYTALHVISGRVFAKLKHILYIKKTESGKLITVGAIEVASVLSGGRKCCCVCLFVIGFQLVHAGLELIM